MGFIAKIFSSIFGGAPKAAPPPPVSTGAATKEAQIDEKKNKRRRANLFRTEGGVSGEELEPDETTRRSTIFGN